METVGIREFRENLSDYLDNGSPVAISRHGETVAFLLPTRRKRTEKEKAALDRAAAKLHKILAEKGITEDELVEEFKQLRQQGRK
jgi:antitoxin (DNA-binding transcriptional repressor) of toxin-antitoxin stability system